MSAVEFLGKYEVRRQLGRGAMGTVYEAFDPVIERLVAIKSVKLPDAEDAESAQQIARFRREAQAAGRLHHPNIVGVFDYGETADIAYIVMEYIDGPPLKDLLDKNERFPLPKIVQIMEDLLSGLEFSHERGVVHRDIKPSNLMLTKSGRAKISDFGIARIESSSMTQAGTVLGTPAYMSPEQFMGQIVDARTDIYSSGVLLYQLLTGERPFEGSLSAIMHKALHTEPPWPSQISVTAPRPFDGVVKRAMAKRPEDRYSTPAEFLTAIRSAALAPMNDDSEATLVSVPREPPPTSQTASNTQATTGAPPANGSGKTSKVPILLGAGLAGLVTLGGVGYVLLVGNAPNRPPQTEPVKPPIASTTPAEPVSPPAIQPSTPNPVATQPAPLPEVAQEPPAPTPALPPAVSPPIPSLPPVALAPPPSVIPVTPAPTPVTPQADLSDAIRTQIAAFTSGLPCSMLDGDARDGAVQVMGIADLKAIDELGRKLSSMGLTNPVPSLQITPMDQTFCGWEDLLRPIATAFGDPGNRLVLRLPGNPAFLVKDDYIRPRVTMADFRGELRVDYLDHEGNVQHLYPQVAEPGQHLTAVPSRVLKPGEELNLGDPGPSNRGWQVDEPYGTDLIVAIASETPLFDKPRPSNVEKATTYLKDLKRAIDAARSRGVRMTAAATPLETRNK